MKTNQIICGDTLSELKKLPDNSIDTIITSPPYWGLRDYGVKGQIGLEKTLEEYLKKLLGITAELKRVLKSAGVMFWNHGDCYGGSGKGGGNKNEWKGGPEKYGISGSGTPKCLSLQGHRLILKMIDQQGWILRNTIIWHKPNHMPSSVKDRFANSYEPIFMLVKNKKYWFDLDAVRIPHQYPDDVVRRMHQDKEDGIQPFAKDNKKGIKWRRVPGQAKQSIARHSGYFRDGKCLIDISKGKNPGDVWKIATQPFPEAHFATFPEKLIEPMILAGCPKEICKKCGKVRMMKTIIPAETGTRNVGGRKDGYTTKLKGKWWADKKDLGWTDCNCKAGFNPGTVLDPFIGAGTVGVVAKRNKRNWLGIELNPKYIKMARDRIRTQPEPML